MIEDGALENIAQAHTEIFSYIEVFYDRDGLHSSLGYQSPMEYELNLKNKSGGKDREFYVH